MSIPNCSQLLRADSSFAEIPNDLEKTRAKRRFMGNNRNLLTTLFASEH